MAKHTDPAHLRHLFKSTKYFSFIIMMTELLYPPTQIIYFTEHGPKTLNIPSSSIYSMQICIYSAFKHYFYY